MPDVNKIEDIMCSKDDIVTELEEQLMYPYESEPLNDVELDDYCNQFKQ